MRFNTLTKEDNIIVAIFSIFCIVMFVLGIYQFVQIIQWLWFNVEVTIK